LQLQKPRIQVPAAYRAQLREGQLWEAEVKLHGRSWLLGAIEASQPKTDPPAIWWYLLQAANEQGLPADRPAWVFGQPALLFVDQHGYRVESQFEGAGKDQRLKFVLHEDTPRLADLPLRGSDVQRIQFQGKYLALIESPESVIRLPVDNYSMVQVSVGKSVTSPWSVASEYRTFTVTPTSNAVLLAGSPLTNRVSFTQRGRTLRLKYERIDSAGRNYTPVDQTHPPRFVVSQAGKIVAQGAFEFG
jgi:hypothetical protein